LRWLAVRFGVDAVRCMDGGGDAAAVDDMLRVKERDPIQVWQLTAWLRASGRTGARSCGGGDGADEQRAEQRVVSGWRRERCSGCMDSNECLSALLRAHSASISMHSREYEDRPETKGRHEGRRRAAWAKTVNGGRCDILFGAKTKAMGTLEHCHRSLSC
jgi:hypothetical protein